MHIRINGVRYELTDENCALFFFREDKYNHLFFIRGEEDFVYVFGEPDIFRKLADSQEVAMHYYPHDPPEQDMDAYKKWLAEQPPVDDNPLTPEEVEYYAREFREDTIWEHKDELE